MLELNVLCIIHLFNQGIIGEQGAQGVPGPPGPEVGRKYDGCFYSAYHPI